ncbi:hypothetical protein CEXT_619601 [Caerostris extrusa]|uniref:Uncharacterized protein n=1 Tax=Caerostris extrusa TaxID=172846 RepID=A0AAV4YDD7_CAEEX|nr:hypothetical protein CEXT_619601 [Caerostris extrusa]
MHAECRSPINPLTTESEFSLLRVMWEHFLLKLLSALLAQNAEQRLNATVACELESVYSEGGNFISQSPLTIRGNCGSLFKERENGACPECVLESGRTSGN